MIRRRAASGLSVLCAFLLCAIVAQSAVAAEGVAAKNTTAVTCIKVVTPKTGDFDDAHCDTANAKKEGDFTHQTIANGTNTKVTVSNKETKNKTTEAEVVAFEGTIQGKIPLVVVCKNATGEGSFTNEEPKVKEHKISKGELTIEISTCQVTKPEGVKGVQVCEVTEPIKIVSNFEGREEIGASKNEMGIEFTPKGGVTTFVELEFKQKKEEPEKCPIIAKFKIEGSAVSTGAVGPGPTPKGTGATQVFTTAMTEKTLTLEKLKAQMTGTFTLRMKEEGSGANPIAFTTT